MQRTALALFLIVIGFTQSACMSIPVGYSLPPVKMDSSTLIRVSVVDARPPEQKRSHVQEAAGGRVAFFGDETQVQSLGAYVEQVLNTFDRQLRSGSKVTIEKITIQAYVRGYRFNIPASFAYAPLVVAGVLPAAILVSQGPTHSSLFPSTLLTKVVLTLDGELFEHETQTQIQSSLTPEEIGMQLRHTIDIVAGKLPWATQ